MFSSLNHAWLRAPLMLGFVILLLVPGGEAAAQESGPISLGLFPPVQILNETKSVHGFRLSLIYGKNADLKGVDISLVSKFTGGGGGVIFSAVGMTDGSFTGWQNGWLYNQTGGEFTGLQNAAINNSASVKGVLFGIVNKTDRMSGFTLGLVNITEELSGLQIGLLCIAKNAKGHTILPIVNWVF